MLEVIIVKKFTCIVIVTLALLVSVSFITPALAAMGGIDGFALTGAADKDFAGAGSSIGKDGKPDAEFTVRISGTAGAISGFSLKNLTVAQEWNTSGNPNVLVIVNSKGEVVNSFFPRVSFLLATDFKLYVNDREAIMAVGGEYELTVRFIDNSTATARTIIEAAPDAAAAHSRRDRGTAAPAASTAPAAGNAKIISSSSLGKGNYDLTNETKKLGSNMNPDYRIDVSLAGSDTLTGVRIRATGGNAPDKTWDTVSTTSNPLVAVTEQGKGTPLNSPDGSISIPIKDLRDLSFWFDGNDDIKRQDFRLTLLYVGGRIEETDIKQAAVQAPAPAGGGRPQRSAHRGVQMKAKPVEIKLDVVGKNRQKQTSGLKDFSFMIDVRGEGTVKVISVVNQVGQGRWDTVPGSSAWLTIVRKGGSQANDPKDFSVSIPVRGTETLELLMENDGTLANSQGRLLVSVTWDDGEVVEELLTW